MQFLNKKGQIIKRASFNLLIVLGLGYGRYDRCVQNNLDVLRECLNCFFTIIHNALIVNKVPTNTDTNEVETNYERMSHVIQIF